MSDRSVVEFLASIPLLKATPEDSAQEAAIAMAAHRCDVVLVCRDEMLVGIVTERDLVARVMALGRGLDTPLIEVMTANPDIIASHATISDAISQMRALGCRHLPVVETGRLLGILSIHDPAFAETALGLPAASDGHAERAGQAALA